MEGWVEEKIGKGVVRKKKVNTFTGVFLLLFNIK
jgi:hypothetical protein